MPLTSSVVSQSISNFRLYCCSKKIAMLRKKVKLLLEQLQVCIFAEIVFGVRCTLNNINMFQFNFLWDDKARHYDKGLQQWRAKND